MWHRDDPGFPPSPDPAAEAERYYAERDRHEPDPDDCGGRDCGNCLRCQEREREEERRQLAVDADLADAEEPEVRA